jgi:hypothetical protein
LRIRGEFAAASLKLEIIDQYGRETVEYPRRIRRGLIEAEAKKEEETPAEICIRGEFAAASLKDGGWRGQGRSAGRPGRRRG